MKTTGSYLARLRDRLGLTQGQLAKRVGVQGQCTVSRLETGAHWWSAATVVQYSGALNQPWHALFGYDHPPTVDLSAPKRQLALSLAAMDDEVADILVEIARAAMSDSSSDTALLEAVRANVALSKAT